MTRTVYDGFGRQQYVQDRASLPVGGSNTVAPATLSVYDPSGRVIMSERCSGVQLNWLSATSADYTSLAGSVPQIKMTVVAAGTVLSTNQTFYDGAGNVQFTADARGALTQYQYDGANRRTNVLVYMGWSMGATNPTPLGATQCTSYTYDGNGNQLSVTDAAGNVVTNQYDAANRLIEVDYPAPGGGTVSQRTVYDGLGRKIQSTDEAGVSTAYSYDFRGLLTSVTLAAGTTQQVTTVYSYDELGNQITQTDANGHSTTNGYDALGRRTARWLPGGQTETFGYDAAGNLAWHTNFSGGVITNLYDVADRLTNCSGPGYCTTYAYSSTGLRTNMVDASGSSTYTYDNMNLLTNKVVALAGGPVLALNYRYDALGSLTNVWSGTLGGVTNQYQYDALGRLAAVQAGTVAAAGYGYDAVGNLQGVQYANGVTGQYQYDARNRLTNSVWRSAAAALAIFAYAVAPTGNRTALAETVNGSSRTYNWAYDYLYRMTGETFSWTGISGSPAVAYTFDAVGNRTSRNSGLSGIANQAATFTANDWLASDGYDSNGNTTLSGTTNYQYDVLGHLTNANNGQVLMTYDGDGNRVSKTVSGTRMNYLVDDRNPSGYAQVLEEYQGSTLSRVYNYGLALISQRQAPSGTISYYGTDGHGSTRFLMDTSGNVTDTYTYDAYGIMVANTGTTLNNYFYCGQQWDGNLGMYYLRARYYRPDTGRFWTMDTYEGNSEDPLSLHKYLYCKDGPINGIDPSGHAEDVDVMAGSFIGTVIDTFSAAATTIARVASISRINAIAQVTAAAYTGYLGYDVARVEVKNWVEKGKNVFRQRFPNRTLPKIVPIPEPFMPAVAEHIRVHQLADPSSMFLTRASIGVNIKNRAKVLLRSWALQAGTGMSWDEYPFASSQQGGTANVSLWPVPLVENTLQGGVIWGAYQLEDINPGDEFAVVVVF